MLQFGYIVTITFLLFIILFLNAACLAYYVMDCNFIYHDILHNKYVEDFNVIGKVLIIVITFPFTLFTLYYYVMSNIVYWAWLIVRLIFSKSRNTVIEEHREHMKDTCWYSRLTML